MGALNTMALVLSARVAVLLAIGGGIGLTAIALQNPDPYRLGTLAIYAVMAVLIAWLVGR